MSIPIQHGMIWQGRARHRAQGAGHATMYSTEYRQGSRAGFSGPSDARLTQAPDRKVDLLTCFLSFFLCVFVLFLYVSGVRCMCFFFFFFFFSVRFEVQLLLRDMLSICDLPADYYYHHHYYCRCCCCCWTLETNWNDHR